MNTERTEKFVNAIACDLEEGGFRQVSGTTLRRTLATAVSAALPLLADTGIPASQPAELAEQQAIAEFLKERDEALGCPDATDGERAESARLIAALAATGKQQAGEVQGDALAGLAEACEDMRAAAEECDIGEGLAHAVPFHQWNEFLCKLDHAVQALAARQPGALEPVVCTDEDLLGELDEAADHGATLSVTYLRELAKRSAAALRTADPVMFAHAANLQAGLEVAERYGDDLRRQLKDVAPPAQGIDLGQLRRYTHVSWCDPVAGSIKSDMVLVPDGEWVRLGHVRDLIDQRDAAPGVSQ